MAKTRVHRIGQRTGGAAHSHWHHWHHLHQPWLPVRSCTGRRHQRPSDNTMDTDGTIAREYRERISYALSWMPCTCRRLALILVPVHQRNNRCKQAQDRTILLTAAFAGTRREEPRTLSKEGIRTWNVIAVLCTESIPNMTTGSMH